MALIWIFFGLSNNERQEFWVGAGGLLASGFRPLASATHHRLHIPFPIDIQKPETRNQKPGEMRLVFCCASDFWRSDFWFLARASSSVG